ncbi:MAG: hypothetical protein ACREPA_09585 [Candidatus Dormibacteraceae bacterium]
MIDRTNLTIEEMEEEIRRENERRNAFYTLLHASDRVLWKLEEMNRDGVKQVPGRTRSQIRTTLEPLPAEIRGRFRDTGVVQEMLDSIFEIQEGLFRWRYPDWNVGEDDGLIRAS